ncbi:hydrolase [Xylaria sp. CBS 124048]|nr:hydrolase [Xylaria sp. CBS 124048]
MASPNSAVMESLIAEVTGYVKDYMANYDASHDFNHIRRVVHLARHIQASTPGTSRDVVILAALLHDVGDKKYLKPGEDGARLVHDVLTSLGAPAGLASKVQAICHGVSYSSEVKDPARVVELIKEYPELAVVQDADRLDAIGAVGIGRTFTYGGAKGRPMEQTMAHFEEKLLRLEGLIKTDAGRQLAKQRTDRLRLMQQWWADETDGVDNAL